MPVTYSAHYRQNILTYCLQCPGKTYDVIVEVPGCCHILVSGDLESFLYVFFFSILNESIPKDEADQLLQDLLHEMSKFLLQVTRRACNPNLRVVTLCILYNCM